MIAAYTQLQVARLKKEMIRAHDLAELCKTKYLAARRAHQHLKAGNYYESAQRHSMRADQLARRLKDAGVDIDSDYDPDPPTGGW